MARRPQHWVIGGFILLGVTGARDALPPHLADFVKRVRAVTRAPLAVGFGISTPEQAHAVGQLADGVIVGSALVRRVLEAENSVSAAEELRDAVAALRSAMERA